MFAKIWNMTRPKPTSGVESDCDYGSTLPRLRDLTCDVQNIKQSVEMSSTIGRLIPRKSEENESSETIN